MKSDKELLSSIKISDKATNNSFTSTHDKEKQVIERLLIQSQDFTRSETAPTSPKNGATSIVSIDEAIKMTQKQQSWFQIITFVVISVPIMMSVTILYSIHYLQLEPKLLCSLDGKFYPCDKQEYCSLEIGVTSKIDLDNPYTLHNWIIDLDLVCAPQWKVAMLGVSLYIGYFVGSLFVGPYADIYGRRKIFLLTSLVFMISNGLMLVLLNVYAYSFLLFIYGMTGSGRMIVGHIYATEFFGGQSKGQQVMTTVIKVMCAATPIFTTTLFLYITKSWVVLYVIMLSLTGIGFIFSIFVPESPKYLVNIGKYDEAKEIIQNMSMINNNSRLDFILINEIEQKDNNLSQQKKITPQMGLYQKFISLLRNSDKVLMKRFYIMCAMWFLGYFGFIFMKLQIKNISGDVFQNTNFAALADVSGTLIIGVINLFLGIRLAFFISFMISVVFGILLMIFQSQTNENIISALVFFSNFGVSAAYLICLIGAVTLFPTKIKATSYSLGNMMSRFAGIFAPVFVEASAPIPMLTFISVSALGAVISLGLDTTIPVE